MGELLGYWPLTVVAVFLYGLAYPLLTLTASHVGNRYDVGKQGRSLTIDSVAERRKVVEQWLIPLAAYIAAIFCAIGSASLYDSLTVGAPRHDHSNLLIYGGIFIEATAGLALFRRGRSIWTTASDRDLWAEVSEKAEYPDDIPSLKWFYYAEGRRRELASLSNWSERKMRRAVSILDPSSGFDFRRPPRLWHPFRYVAHNHTMPGITKGRAFRWIMRTPLLFRCFIFQGFIAILWIASIIFTVSNGFNRVRLWVLVSAPIEMAVWVTVLVLAAAAEIIFYARLAAERRYLLDQVDVMLDRIKVGRAQQGRVDTVILQVGKWRVSKISGQSSVRRSPST